MFVYIVYCRYEYQSLNGKTFTEWFKFGPGHNSEKEAKEFIKSKLDTIRDVDRHTKLKHEFEIRYIDEMLIPQPKLTRPKGRPKKIDEEYLNKVIKQLNKKGIAEIDENIKGYLYNDQIAKDYINKKIKDKTKYIIYWYNENKKLYLVLKDNESNIS